jgi:hypothetical protein
MNDDKLIINNIDGTTTEVTPLQLWTPGEEDLPNQAFGIEITQPKQEKPMEYKPNRRQRRRMAALKRKNHVK